MVAAPKNVLTKKNFVIMSLKPSPTYAARQALCRKLIAQLVICELSGWSCRNRRDIPVTGLGLTNVNRVTWWVSRFICKPDRSKRFHLPGAGPVFRVRCHDQGGTKPNFPCGLLLSPGLHLFDTGGEQGSSHHTISVVRIGLK